jgi:hypothetical protein
MLSLNLPTDHSITSRFGPRLVVLLLVFAALGLPINDLLRYGLLIVSAVIIFTGRVSLKPGYWVSACAIVVVAIAGKIALHTQPIEEGHNIFLVDGSGGALERGLPADVFRIARSEFDALYPPQSRCSREDGRCWRAQGFPKRTFAFSADGIWDSPLYSRRVGSIDFDDPVRLRLGFINDVQYNWNGTVSDIKRLRRDGRFWMGLHRWHLMMPWSVMYRLPPDRVGGKLCWTGDVVWETQPDRFELLRNASSACRVITQDDAGRRIFGLAIRPDTLAMKLEPPFIVSLRHFAGVGLMVFAIGAVLVVLVRPDRRASALPFLLIGLSVLVMAIDDGSFLGGFRPLDDGEDSLFYESVARGVAENLRFGNIMAALEGGERVFYFGGSGFRYPRALERIIFGDTNFGYVAANLAFPLLMYAVFVRLLSVRWALALTFVFVAVPVGALFGTTFYQYAAWSARGYADPAGVFAAVGGFLLLLGLDAENPRQYRRAFFASMLFAFSIVLRPNGAVFAAVMLTGVGLVMLCHRQWPRYLLLCLGFVPVILPGLHNWYFGHVFVPFNSNWTHPEALVMPPWRWAAALADAVRFNWASQSVIEAAHQLRLWLSGPAELAVLIPLHIAAIAILFAVAIKSAYRPIVRLAAAATLCQHLGMLCYAVTPRYHIAAWLFTYLVVVVWLRETGVAWFRRSFPIWADRIDRHHTVRTLKTILDDFARRQQSPAVW